MYSKIRNPAMRFRRQSPQNYIPLQHDEKVKKNERKLLYSRIKLGLVIGVITILLSYQISKLNEYASRFSDTVAAEDEFHSVPENKIGDVIVTSSTTERSHKHSDNYLLNGKSKPRLPIEDRIKHFTQFAIRNSILQGKVNSINMSNRTTAGLCALMKNDEDIDEWVDYNLGIGFDQIYIYDNSDKNTLKKWGATKDSRVKIIHWPGLGNQDATSQQNCLSVEGKKHTWMALFHRNEFLVLKKHDNVVDFLSNYHETESLILNRYVFDLANKTDYGPIPVTQQFMYRGISLYVRIKNIVNMKVFGLNQPHKIIKGNLPSINVPLHIAVVQQYGSTQTKTFLKKGLVYDDSAWELLVKKVPAYGKYVSPTTRQQTAALCVLMKAEELYVDEWVDYNLGIGFDQIVIYDNSDNNTMKEWGDTKDRVKVIHWPGLKRQHRSQVHCLNEVARKHTWMALFDGDEFLVLKKHSSVVDFLTEHCQRGSVAINWSIFGTGNKTAYEPLPVTKRFMYREANLSNTIKSIVKTADFDPNKKITNPHSFPLRSGVLQHDTDGKTNFSPAGAANKEGGPSDVALVHHYRYKSLEEWRYKGCVRKMAANSDRQCSQSAVVGSVYDDSAWVTLKKNVPKYEVLYDNV